MSNRVARVYEWVIRWRLTITTTILLVAVVFLFVRQERTDGDLASEAKARTAESCRSAAERTHATRLAFEGIFTELDAQAIRTGGVASPFIADLRKVINRELPELSCPQTSSPIVIPQPSATQPTNP